MLLAVDIGNTNVTVGIFEGERLRATWRMASNIEQMPDEYAATLLNLMRHRGLETTDIKEIAMCCVVPPLLPTFEEVFRAYFHVAPLIIGPGTKTGVRIRIDNPREAGTDRIVNSAAAHYLYEGPSIVADIGTATTFDVVSREGDYIGGVIAPGIVMAASALFTRAAALPRVELVAPKKAIGTNTITAMQSGIIFGYVGLVEGIVARIQRELDEKALVVATGGQARIIAKETRVIDQINPDLTLIGLRLIHGMQQA